MADRPPGCVGPDRGQDSDCEGAEAGSAVTVCQSGTYRGQPAVYLALAQGDAAWISLQGAQVLSWVAQGRERLFLSPQATFNGHAAIRGGVPVCFPQFNQRGPLVKHGFARHLMWQTHGDVCEVAGQAVVSLHLADSPATRDVWPHRFAATVRVALAPGALQVTLEVCNQAPSASPESDLSFTGALHTYLAVDDIDQACLSGLAGQAEWNAVTDVHGLACDPLTFGGEFDRVYAAATQPLSLHDGGHCLRISQSATFADTVVWTPGAALCAKLADMPENGHRHMLCVEAAAVHGAVTVPGGATWRGWQRLEVV